MKKLIVALLMISLVACSKEEMVTKTYKIETASNDGYYGVSDDKTGIAFDNSDTKETIKVGDTVKITFTKKQYESMEGLKKVELVK